MSLTVKLICLIRHYPISILKHINLYKCISLQILFLLNQMIVLLQYLFNNEI